MNTALSRRLSARGISRFIATRLQYRSQQHDEHRRSGESGYAYLFTLFLVLAVVISSTAAVQSFVTQGRRQREEEMMWRGKQYIRAIRLFSRKTGRAPTTIDDLKKGSAQLHFLRSAAYTDPTNTADGSWRFIYANQGGQIFGSVRYATFAQMMLMDQNSGQLPQTLLGTQPGLVGTPAANITNPLGGLANPASQNTQTPQASGQDASANQPSSQSSADGPNSGQVASSDQNSSQSAANGQNQNPILLLKPTGPVDGPVVGAFLDGVGGSSERTSVKVYAGGKKYQAWEFLWNPLEDQAAALQQGLNPGQSAQPGQPGQLGQANGLGNTAGAGAAGSNGNTNPNDNSGAGPNGASPNQTPLPQEQPSQPTPQQQPQ